jgi:hypothetical protein
MASERITIRPSKTADTRTCDFANTVEMLKLEVVVTTEEEG